MAVKTLNLMRHGETVFNTKNLIQGQCDSPLTANGRAQAALAGAYFKEHDISFNAVYVSMLHRTEETLAEITDQPYTRLAGLNERSYGKMEGESQRITAGMPYEERSQIYALCGAEDGEAVSKRMNETLRSVMEENEGTVLCISHGAAIAYFNHSLQDARVPDHLSNCHILKYEYEDGVFRFKEDYQPL